MIYIANDHGGVALKNEIVSYLNKLGYDVTNLGTDSDDAVDYPIYAKKVAEKILQNPNDKGILICGTGIGISITANRYEGVRCALCSDVFSARATREHNDANILALGARVTGTGLALLIVEEFLKTPFSNEQRHIDRINLIDDVTNI